MSDEQTIKLSIREANTMLWFKQNIAGGFCTGTRRIVTMQALAKHGLVKPVYVRGFIADWSITEAGKRWNAK